tara:strand:- start:1690 stop:2145 length:456 start_codon:yes stop_codon:yes gene_type:complete
MATTVTAATLTVNIQESITLNGVTYDKTTTKSIASVANYHSRVVQLKASTTHTVVSLASDPSNANFDSDDFKYMRITNLDDTNAVQLNLTDASDATVAIEIGAGNSFTLFDTSIDGNASGNAITTTPHTIESVVLVTPAAEVDVEIVVATV